MQLMRRVAKQLASLSVTIVFSVALLLFVAALLAPGSVTFRYDEQGVLQIVVAWRAVRLAMVGFVKEIVKGDFGLTAARKPVLPVVLAALGRSLSLLLPALSLALILGMAKGAWDYRRSGRPLGGALAGFGSIAFQAIPDFAAAIGLQYLMVILYLKFDWKPFPLNYHHAEPLRSLVLPILSLTLVPAGFIARLTAVFLAEVYASDYIRTARSKGVSEGQIVWRHALKNVFAQLLDALPGVFLSLASNLLVVEAFFLYPGLAGLMLDALTHRGRQFTELGWAALGGPDLSTLLIGGLTFVLLFNLLSALLQLGRLWADRRLGSQGVEP